MNKYVVFGIFSILFIGIIFSSGCLIDDAKGYYHRGVNKVYNLKEGVLNAPENLEKGWKEATSAAPESGEITNECGLDDICLSSKMGAYCVQIGYKVRCEEETDSEIIIHCCDSEKCTLKQQIDKSGANQLQIEKAKGKAIC